MDVGEIFETGSATYRVSRKPRLYHYLITRDKETLGISVMTQCLHNSLEVPTHGSFTAALNGSALSFTYPKQCGNFSCLPRRCFTCGRSSVCPACISVTKHKHSLIFSWVSRPPRDLWMPREKIRNCDYSACSKHLLH